MKCLFGRIWISETPNAINKWANTSELFMQNMNLTYGINYENQRKKPVESIAKWGEKNWDATER